MASDLVFVDTWAHTALLSQQDQWHAEALALSRKLETDNSICVTTEWVLTEFLNSVARPPLRLRAVEYIRMLCISPVFQILPSSHAEWLRGFDFYGMRTDKEWSLVDCMSILACQDRGIVDVFTGDHHFEQAGLRILLQHDT